MTRGYAILKEKGKEIARAYIDSSAYPSWAGLAILRAAATGKMREYIDDENSSLDSTEVLKKQFDVDFVYTFDQSTGLLTVHDGSTEKPKLFYKVSLPDELHLYEFIFENEEEIERQLCINEGTLKFGDGGRKEIVKNIRTHHWGRPEFEQLLRRSTRRVYFNCDAHPISPQMPQYKDMPTGFQYGYTRGLSVRIEGLAAAAVELSAAAKEGPAFTPGVAPSWSNGSISFDAVPGWRYSRGPGRKGEPVYRLYMQTPCETYLCGDMKSKRAALAEMVNIAKQYELLLPHIAYAMEVYIAAKRVISRLRQRSSVTDVSVVGAVLQKAEELIEAAIPPEMGDVLYKISAHRLSDMLREHVALKE